MATTTNVNTVSAELAFHSECHEYIWSKIAEELKARSNKNYSIVKNWWGHHKNQFQTYLLHISKCLLFPIQTECVICHLRSRDNSFLILFTTSIIKFHDETLETYGLQLEEKQSLVDQSITEFSSSCEFSPWVW